MKPLLILLVILSVVSAAGWFITSCSCSSCGKEELAEVPLDVLNKANSFIISRTGEEFFNKYITPDFARTKHVSPYYEMVYRLFVPDKPYVNALIKFSVDSLGSVEKKRDILGIPNCLNNPVRCDWQIDEDAATLIAEKYGLEKGVKEWQVGFIWNPEREIYVWHVLTTTREFEGDFGYRANGKEMIIDPVSGDVLASNDWKIN